MTVLAALCIAVMVLSLMLLFLGLPGNWVIFCLALLWSLFAAATPFPWSFFILLAVLGGIGEAAEFLAGHFGAKRFGGTNKGSLGGMVGALVGGILCAPLLFGFGALLGVLGGCFLGCFIVERGRGMETGLAIRAASGSTLGRFGGFVAKLGVGIAMLWLCIPKIWGSF